MLDNELQRTIYTLVSIVINIMQYTFPKLMRVLGYDVTSVAAAAKIAGSTETNFE